LIKAIAAAAVATLLLIAVYTWWFQAPWLVTLGYAVVSVLALALVPLCYRWFGFLDMDVIQKLLDQEEREHNEMMQRLSNIQNDLESLDNDEGASQVVTLKHLLNDFHEVIANRFRGKQLSSSTYLDAARNVQNQSLQNLSDMVGIGHSISSLNRQSGNGEATQQPQQLTMQQQRLDDLLSENRRLFKALSDTSVEVANIQEIGEFERTETLARLKDLVSIAKQQSQ
jgi:hypothetical protein